VQVDTGNAVREGAIADGERDVGDAVDGTAAAPAVPELWLSVIVADDGSCWDTYDDLFNLAAEMHAEMLGLRTERTEVCAANLALDEARAWVLRTAVAGVDVELARGACEFDFHARRFAVRCGFKKQGEHTKRHVHTLTVHLFRPSMCQHIMATNSL